MTSNVLPFRWLKIWITYLLVIVVEIYEENSLFAIKCLIHLELTIIYQWLEALIHVSVKLDSNEVRSHLNSFELIY